MDLVWLRFCWSKKLLVYLFASFLFFVCLFVFNLNYIEIPTRCFPKSFLRIGLDLADIKNVCLFICLLFLCFLFFLYRLSWHTHRPKERFPKSFIKLGRDLLRYCWLFVFDKLTKMKKKLKVIFYPFQNYFKNVF